MLELQINNDRPEILMPTEGQTDKQMDECDVFNKIINKLIVCYYCLYSVTVVYTFLEKPQMRKSKVSVKI